MKYQITGYQVIYRNGNRDNKSPCAPLRRTISKPSVNR